jgi:hypothetical protein
MRSVWLLVLAASGCRAVLGFEDAIVVDATVDVPACARWRPVGFDPCTLGAPMPSLNLGPGAYVYDTTLGGGKLSDGAGNVVVASTLTVAQADQSSVAVLSVDAFTVAAGATLSVVGPRPLLVVSWSTIAVDGVIDAGSHLGVTDAARHIAQTTQFGAGASQACSAGAGKAGGDAPASGGSGGGGGGGFQGTGGPGGPGGNLGAAGGAGGPVAALPLIRGGCPGGAGGAAGPIAILPATSASRALGGAGGGAIRLAARLQITVAGSIGANGAAGAGAPTRSACGGGGGGAGGYVGLDAPSLMISGTITANGGGGGGGGATTGAGNDGSDGKIDVQAAPGGALATGACGRPGGSGSVQMTLAGTSAGGSDGCGGGGGGGAAGFLIVASDGYAATTAARLSPPTLQQ